MNTLQDRTISKSLFYITNNNNKAHFLICGKHKQLVNKNTWEECSHIKTETAKIFKTNKNIKKFMLEFDIPEGSLFKTTLEAPRDDFPAGASTCPKWTKRVKNDPKIYDCFDRRLDARDVEK